MSGFFASIHSRLIGESGETNTTEAKNFGRLLTSAFFTKLGDAIASPKTVLAWLWTQLGAPPYLLGMLVPVRESGSMVPQILSATYIRKLPIRKWVCVVGAALQGLCVLGMAACAALLRGEAAGWTLLGLVALFSLARSLNSVASKDVIGKCVSKGARGRLAGYSASLAGLVSIGIGVALAVPYLSEQSGPVLAALLAGAGALWLIAAVLFAGVAEEPGEVASATPALRQTLSRLRLLIDDRPFRHFVATRALMMCSALSAPFYIALAQQRVGDAGHALGYFVVAAGLASLLSGPVWGKMADRSSRKVMQLAALGTAALALLVFVVFQFVPEVGRSVWFVPLCYFLLNVAHGGARIGRKTYVINLAEGNQRTDYVATSNAVIGVLLLAVGSVGLLTEVMPLYGVILVLGCMGVIAGVLAHWLPEVEAVV